MRRGTCVRLNYPSLPLLRYPNRNLRLAGPLIRQLDHSGHGLLPAMSDQCGTGDDVAGGDGRPAHRQFGAFGGDANRNRA